MEQTPAVFYFEFQIDDETIKTYGFAVSPEGAVHLADAENGPDMEYFDLDVEDYGVHDWCTGPDDRVIGTGYHTYEVAQSDIQTVMKIWRTAYVKKCGKHTVTPIVEIPHPTTLENDYAYYEAVMSQVNLLSS
jgi:hypothetical protein